MRPTPDGSRRCGPSPWWVTGAVGVLVAVQLAAVLVSGPGTVLLVLDPLVALAAVALVPGMLGRRAVPLVCVAAALAALSPVATPVASAGVYLVSRTRAVDTAVRVALVSVAGHLVAAAWRPVPSLGLGWQVLLVVLAHAALVAVGAYLRTRAELLASLEARARRAEEEQAARVAEARAVERARLAHEMHDVLAHRLSLIATYAGALEYRPDADPARVAEAAGVVRAGVQEALAEVREVVALLREGDHEQARARSLLDLPRLVEETRRAGTPVELDGPDGVVGVGDRLAVPAGHAAYRVVQEGLSNVRRHAPGATAHVRVAATPTGVAVEVRSASPSAAVRPGNGLTGLRERVALLGGTLTVTADGHELVLRAEIPGGRA